MENAVSGKLNFSKAFADALEVYKRNFLILALATLLLQLITTLSLFILAGPIVGGFYWMMLNAMRSENKKIDLGLMFKSFNRFWSLLGLFYLQTFVVIIAFMLFIVDFFS